MRREPHPSTERCIYLRSGEQATGEQLLKFGRRVIVLFGLFMGTFAVILNWMGLSLGWVYLFMGIMIGSAVVPVFFVLLWSKARRTLFCVFDCDLFANAHRGAPLRLPLLRWRHTEQKHHCSSR